MTKTQLASHWRLSTRAIEQYRRAGLPAERRDGEWCFPLRSAEQWRRDNREPARQTWESDLRGVGRPDERAPPPITS